MATLYSSRSGAPAAARAHQPLSHLAALAVAGCLAAQCGARGPDRPGVLLIVVSGLRADRVGAYGYPGPTTPSIDALAAAGTLFQNAVSSSAWGPAAQASILTGLYPSEHGVSFSHPGLEESVGTLAEAMKGQGYATFAATTDPDVSPGAGFGRGFDSFVEIHPDQEASPDDGAASAEKALADWLAETSSRSPDLPAFAYVVLTNPRLPFSPPAEYREKHLDRPVPLPRLERLSQLWIPFARQFEMGVAEASAEDLAALKGLYDAEVAYADYRVGRMVEALRASGRLDSTLVILTADTGEDLADHGLLANSTRLYDSIVKVPLILRLPGRVPAGRRVAAQVQPLDLPDAVARLTAPSSTHGERGEMDAGALLRARPAAISEARFDPGALRQYRSILPREDLSIFEQNQLAVRTLEYKYIITSSNTGALFSLATDPSEQTSVLSSEQARGQELAAFIPAWAASLRPPPAGAAGPIREPSAAPAPDPAPRAPAR